MNEDTQSPADLKDFLVSIDRIEEAAGFDFFSALADSVEDALGSVAAESYQELASSLHFSGYLFVAAIAVLVIVVFVVKKLLERSEARHWDRPGDGDVTTIDDD